MNVAPTWSHPHSYTRPLLAHPSCLNALWAPEFSPSWPQSPALQIPPWSPSPAPLPPTPTLVALFILHLALGRFISLFF